MSTEPARSEKFDPKSSEDGILAWIPSYYQGKGGCDIVHWHDGCWVTKLLWKVKPSHWMPLPDAPDLEPDWIPIGVTE